jgi:uncharacterized protein (TIGR03435 family)
MPGRIHFQAVWLKDCIRWAYSVADYQIRGGPGWIERTPRWDIEATAGRRATAEEMREMFRGLLAERFGLEVHREREDTRVLLLTVAGPGQRLKPAADDAPRTDDWRRSPLFQGSKPGPGSSRIRELTSQRVTMNHLAEYLSRQLRLPVLDRTSLDGDYALTVEWPADPLPDLASGPAPSRPPTGQMPDLFGSAGSGHARTTGTVVGAVASADRRPRHRWGPPGHCQLRYRGCQVRRL